jgi:hypothetical protein
MEDVAADGFHPVRFSIDLMRPITSEPITLAAAVIRTGKRLQLVECELTCGGKLGAHASLLLLQHRHVALPTESLGWGNPPPDGPDDFAPIVPFDAPNEVLFVASGIEMRVPDPGVFGGGVAWYRMLLPVVPGREASPMGRAAAAADFGNGLSGFGGVLPRDIAFPNADLSVRLLRVPEGEWIRLQASSTWTNDGIGLATSQLADLQGTFGTGGQSLALDSRAGSA